MSFIKLPVLCVAVLSATGLLALGCGSKKDADGSASAQVAASPGLQGPVAERMRTVQPEPNNVIRGKELYASCAGCHGPNGEGITGAGPRLNSESFLAAASDEMLVRTITEGRSGTTMIPWGASMSRDDVLAVVSYIRSWSDVKSAELNEAPLNGDPAVGKQLFDTICSACHGRSGAGYQETANGTGIGRKAFMNQVSNGYLRYVIKNGKSQTKMKGFDESSRTSVANLTDKQIDDIITHLRMTAW